MSVPQVGVGETIKFWKDGNLESQPGAAIVLSTTGRDDGNITAIQIPRNNVYLVPIMANIYHVDDPRLIDHPEFRRNGLWDVTDLHKRIDALEAKLATRQTAKK